MRHTASNSSLDSREPTSAQEMVDVFRHNMMLFEQDDSILDGSNNTKPRDIVGRIMTVGPGFPGEDMEVKDLMEERNAYHSANEATFVHHFVSGMMKKSNSSHHQNVKTSEDLTRSAEAQVAITRNWTEAGLHQGS